MEDERVCKVEVAFGLWAACLGSLSSSRSPQLHFEFFFGAAFFVCYTQAHSRAQYIGGAKGVGVGVGVGVAIRSIR